METCLACHGSGYKEVGGHRERCLVCSGRGYMNFTTRRVPNNDGGVAWFGVIVWAGGLIAVVILALVVLSAIFK